jgi:hypothetical protein
MRVSAGSETRTPRVRCYTAARDRGQKAPRAVDHSDGLPNVSGAEEARPPDTMPEHDLPRTTRFADATFVGKSLDVAELDGDS